MNTQDECLQIFKDVLPESPGLSLGLAFAAGAYAVEATGLPPFAVHFSGHSATGKTRVFKVLDALELRSADLPCSLIDNTKGSLPRKTSLPVISFGECPVDALIDEHCMIDGSEIKNFLWWSDPRMDGLELATSELFFLGPKIREFVNTSAPDLRKRYVAFSGSHPARIARLGLAILSAVAFPTEVLGAAYKYLPHLKTAPLVAKRTSVYLNSDTVNFLDGRGPSLSGALNQTVERYQAILDATELPEFSADELAALAEALGKAPTPRQEELDELWLSVERGAMDFETGKVSPEMAKLVAKLQNLNMAQAITLRERLEAMGRGRK
jgi:hypothetical protein